MEPSKTKRTKRTEGTANRPFRLCRPFRPWRCILLVPLKYNFAVKSIGSGQLTSSEMGSPLSSSCMGRPLKSRSFCVGSMPRAGQRRCLSSRLGAQAKDVRQGEAAKTERTDTKEVAAMYTVAETMRATPQRQHGKLLGWGRGQVGRILIAARKSPRGGFHPSSYDIKR